MEKNKKKSYYNEKWFAFSDLVKKRDEKCLKCGRKEPFVILQVHHRVYKPGLEPWEYPLSDCITLCKGCHAREHKLIEPNDGWTLISITDREESDGVCERNGCGAEIRYEHLTYHPKWGYKIVGSTCSEHLTEKEQFLGKKVVEIFEKTSNFIDNSIWKKDVTKSGVEFIYTTHKFNQIRIYGNESNYSFQILIKQKGRNWFDYQKIINTKNLSLERVKELGYIVLKGFTTKDEDEKELLRNIYRRIKK
ncbi:MAG TPA: HNH endonuclease signature motif containing protein [Leptospiraceae bacterium]|nr:HNH endonuclease signature motif containing protein [Leptospiraceae bacterium]HMZ67030.1 HNH endonuclease signature motif containing protein [Leptospiraceae bacterium]HNC59557.1 HNH endonuclease signature motif containing protein [Leptospiraceae bacterium]HNE11409.1 HNH endonuclease signature motif containing protein [Leptospiraceae bacterium]HNF57773.1 HNH endonuclease signature motif containing protein [Leptospiraceae bacterium]